MIIRMTSGRANISHLPSGRRVAVPLKTFSSNLGGLVLCSSSMRKLSKFLLVGALFPLILSGCKIETGSTDEDTSAAASITDGISLNDGNFTVDDLSGLNLAGNATENSTADAAGSETEAEFAADAASGSSGSAF